MQTGSVRIEASSHRASVAQHPQTDTPGVAFGISSIVTSNEDGSATRNGVPVKITLHPLAMAPATCDNTSSRNVSSGTVDLGACQLSLPCVGTSPRAPWIHDIEQACDTPVPRAQRKQLG
jgi:hypothetical protein